MHKSLIILIAFCFGASVYGQDNIKKHVKKNAILVKTIDPDSTNFTDLEALGSLVGDSKVVMLGEQEHGDAPTFLAKTRLIKYLHEQKGFNVIAFESDFFGLNYGWDSIAKTQENITRFIGQNIFPVWTGCYACSDLFYNYIPASYDTPTPLIVTGFDNQMILGYSSKYLITKLDSVLKSHDLPVTKERDYNTKILPLIDSLRFWFFTAPTDTSLYSTCNQYLLTIQQQAVQKLSKDNFWMIVIENLVQENSTYQNRQTKLRVSRNIRDHQMASNLKWLIEHKWPNEKIIVWAANAHVAKYADTSNKEKTAIAMGSFFTIDTLIRNKTYVIGFTSYDGKAGMLGSKIHSISKPRSNGFENWIDKTYNYAFVDFKSYKKLYPNTAENFFLKGLGHINFITDWTSIFDGVFYIKKMYSCQK